MYFEYAREITQASTTTIGAFLRLPLPPTFRA